ncbi:MAG: sigma-E processing peptidase SpoIIGA [Lachnospiraceae bacterium]|nr:sigma-E processing peptidase SpoIIGA [Lachnospiraceae bacterium]
MYYEFYIDQFFVEHLLTGYLLMRLTVKISRADISWKRVLAGSFVNTVTMMLAICAGVSWWYFSGLLLAGAFLFAGKTWKNLINGMISLLLVTICFGGMLEAILGLWGLPPVLGAIFAAVLVEAANTYREKQRLQMERIVEIKLTFLEKTASVCGMIDTGNQLTEPLTGRPVSIVEETAVKALLGDGWEARRGFYLIPYHSLGKDKGWMKGVLIDQMVVGKGERAAVILKPLLALYNGEVSTGKQYQMILHPQHAAPGKIEGGE